MEEGRRYPLRRRATDSAKRRPQEFEEAFVDVLTATSEGVSFSRRMKLRLARSRLRAHKDFTQREYDAAVLRADAHRLVRSRIRYPLLANAVQRVLTVSR